MKKFFEKIAVRGLLFQGFVPLAPAPASSKLGALYGSSDLATFLSNLFAAALSIGAILAVLRLAYAGYQYMTSEAWGSLEHAKEVIGDVVLGLLLLLSIWLILYQINPNILNLNFLQSVKQLPSSSGSGGSIQQFSTQPASNSFFGGTGGYYDSSINGSGVSGNQTGDAQPQSP